MAQQCRPSVEVGSSVRIRTVDQTGQPLDLRPPAWANWKATPESVITIVPRELVGTGRLTPQMPLGRALLGRRVGDIVQVRAQAATVWFKVLAIGVPVDLDESLRSLFGEGSRGWS